LRRVFILFQLDGFFFEIFDIDGSLVHLIVGCEDVELGDFFVPGVAI